MSAGISEHRDFNLKLTAIVITRIPNSHRAGRELGADHPAGYKYGGDGIGTANLRMQTHAHSRMPVCTRAHMHAHTYAQINTHTRTGKQVPYTKIGTMFPFRDAHATGGFTVPIAPYVRVRVYVYVWMCGAGDMSPCVCWRKTRSTCRKTYAYAHAHALTSLHQVTVQRATIH